MGELLKPLILVCECSWLFLSARLQFIDFVFVVVVVAKLLPSIDLFK